MLNYLPVHLTVKLFIEKLRFDCYIRNLKHEHDIEQINRTHLTLVFVLNIPCFYGDWRDLFRQDSQCCQAPELHEAFKWDLQLDLACMHAECQQVDACLVPTACNVLHTINAAVTYRWFSGKVLRVSHFTLIPLNRWFTACIPYSWYASERAYCKWERISSRRNSGRWKNLRLLR